jgi:hypothetical protein
MPPPLGKHELLAVRALQSLESREGPARFRVWAVLKEIFVLSDQLQRLKARRERRSAKFWQRLEEQADAGDERAKTMLMLGASIRGSRSRRGRKNQRGESELVEAINPSRIFARLAERGLVDRAWGVVGLTEAGRAIGSDGP